MGATSMIKRTLLAIAFTFLIAAGMTSAAAAQDATPAATEPAATALPSTGTGSSQDNNNTMLLIGFVAAVGLVGVTGYTAFRRSSR
ncbi:MAG: hypothetical protein WBA46_18590 [Thermomicrobiales bacterium]